MIPRVWDLTGKTITQNQNLYTVSPLNPSEFNPHFYYLITTQDLTVNGIQNTLIAVVDTTHNSPNSVRFIANSNTLTPPNIRYIFRLENTLFNINANINDEYFQGYIKNFNNITIENLATVIPQQSGYRINTLNVGWYKLLEEEVNKPAPGVFNINIYHYNAEFVEIDLLADSWGIAAFQLINSSTNTVIYTQSLYATVSKYFVPISWYKKDLVRNPNAEPVFVIRFPDITIDHIRYTIWGGKATGGLLI